ncbi:hypothetical protein [Sinorhizobium meliloti]|uniref:hypothetical protein n=1 Tax=Rhizobium meliloti TaxID=382 RepID=UPI00299F11FC
MPRVLLAEFSEKAWVHELRLQGGDDEAFELVLPEGEAVLACALVAGSRAAVMARRDLAASAAAAAAL